MMMVGGGVVMVVGRVVGGGRVEVLGGDGRR